MTRDCEISKEDTVVLIRSLLSSTNTPCSVYALNKDFRAETGFNIPLFGYSTLSDFLRSIPETVRTTGIHPIEKVQLVSHEKSAHIVSLVQRQKPSSKKYGRKTHTINSSVYYPKTNNDNNKRAPVKSPNFEESSSFKRYVTNSGILNTEKNYEGKREKIHEEKEDKEVIKFSYVPKSLPSFREVLRFEDKISPMDLNLYAQVGTYVEVSPSKIYDPHKFYLQFRKNKKKLGRLMNELQLFYEEDTEFFLMPNEAVKGQRTCAALYENNSKKSEWCRAEITNVINDFEVIVILIDYGIVAKIRKENLRYLHRRFSSLPKQSFLGSLANIKPLNEESGWTKNATKRFFDLVSGKDLIAGVVEMNSTLNIPWMGVALSFTKETEIHVNDILVKEGFARFEPGVGCDWQVSLSSKTSYQESRNSSSNAGESSQDPFICKDNSSNLTGQTRKIIYVPKNEKLKQMFYLKS